MKLTFLKTLAAVLSLSASAFAAAATAQVDSVHQFLPDNDLWREDSLEAIPNINQDVFTQILQAGYNAYAPLAQARDEELIITNKWEDPTVNANARRVRDSLKSKMVVTINMYGGLARRSEMSIEGFALVLCHELSHAYGGEPLIRPLTEIAAEGQADYMAAKVCLEKILPHIPSSSEDMLTADNGSTQKICTRLFAENTDEHFLCHRKFSAGFSLGNFLSVAKNESQPQYNTPDPFVTQETLLSYPKTVQCRLDSYAAGFMGWERPSCWFKNGSKNNPVSEN
jgi:hypothetical protein